MRRRALERSLGESRLQGSKNGRIGIATLVTAKRRDEWTDGVHVVQFIAPCSRVLVVAFAFASMLTPRDLGGDFARG